MPIFTTYENFVTNLFKKKTAYNAQRGKDCTLKQQMSRTESEGVG